MNSEMDCVDTERINYTAAVNVGLISFRSTICVIVLCAANRLSIPVAIHLCWQRLVANR